MTDKLSEENARKLVTLYDLRSRIDGTLACLKIGGIDEIEISMWSPRRMGRTLLAYAQMQPVRIAPDLFINELQKKRESYTQEILMLGGKA